MAKRKTFDLKFRFQIRSVPKIVRGLFVERQIKTISQSYTSISYIEPNVGKKLIL